MSLVAKVEQLIAEEADGALKALHAIAAHVESLVPGAGGDLSEFKAELKAQVDGFIESLGKQVEDARSAFAARLDDIDAKVSALQANLHSPMAPPSEPPAAEPAAPQG